MLTRKLKDRLRRHWTPSCIKTAEQCMARYFWRYELKIPQGTSKALERGNKIHGQLENYLRGGTLDTLETWIPYLKKLRKAEAMPEEMWELNPNWTPHLGRTPWGRMKTDAYVANQKRVTVVDFKTGRIYPEHKEQVELYALAATKRFTEVKNVVVELWYIDQEEITEKIYTRKKLEDLRPGWTDRIDKVLRAEEFPETPSEDACRWCPANPKAGGKCEKAWKSE